VGAFASGWIDWTIILFMVVAGTNFSLYHLALSRHQLWRTFRGDTEFRIYLALLASATILLAASVYANSTDESIYGSFRTAAFQATSIMTTTGFATTDFNTWSDTSKALLLMLMFIGGCAGSTGGGLKVVRFILFAKIVRLEIEQAFRPNVVRPLRLAGVAIDKAQRHQVVVYFCLVLLIFLVSWMLLLVIQPGTAWEGHESDRLIDTASAVAATLNNIGPGLGVFGPTQNYAFLTPQSKILLSVLMLMGRLELFAILVLFVPSFWRSR
jgi:trk system potassium uptake protein TrkH